MTELSDDLPIAFYGDDFTGSTDAMEALARAGLPTALFIGPPRPEDLRGRGLRAVGIAGCSRTLSPPEMEAELGESFQALKALCPRMVHYKTCSTFDSSPQIGSIGRAIEIGARVFGSAVVPLQVGAPILGRYCVFGNLFARSGLDSDPYRLDRHPTMSRHPITPMTESDLRLHLAAQTRRRIGLLDILSLGDLQTARAKYRELAEAGAEVILIDVLCPAQEPWIGEVLWSQTKARASLFVAGSSGVEYALVAYWRSQGLLPAEPAFTRPRVDRIMVVSGSCSPVTDRQIGWAVQQGAAEIALNTADLVDPGSAAQEIEQAAAQAQRLHAAGKTVICHAARGPSDPRREATGARLQAAGGQARQDSGRVIGEALGAILLRVLEGGGVKRVAVTGGDTSFFVARSLGIRSLEMVAPVAPGCPLCRASVPGSPHDGMEICFKGGQVGREGFFDSVLNPGGAAA